MIGHFFTILILTLSLHLFSPHYCNFFHFYPLPHLLTYIYLFYFYFILPLFFLYSTFYKVLNVAVGKAAMQSSTEGHGGPQRAVDGSTSTFFNPNTCSMTESERNAWWYVNLLEMYSVQLVRIDFGTSCCKYKSTQLTN